MALLIYRWLCMFIEEFIWCFLYTGGVACLLVSLYGVFYILMSYFMVLYHGETCSSDKNYW